MLFDTFFKMLGCLQKWHFLKTFNYVCKFFTYVTKTHANLTTYSRNLENNNDNINFEFMKNSSPLNLNLCQT
jgi:hypothetical protein